MQSTNSEYGSPYLATCHVTFTFTIKLLAPVRLSVAPNYYHQSEYCAKGHYYQLESYMNKFSRQIFTWIYCIEREGARADSNTKISVSPKIQ